MISAMTESWTEYIVKLEMSGKQQLLDWNSVFREEEECLPGEKITVRGGFANVLHLPQTIQACQACFITKQN